MCSMSRIHVRATAEREEVKEPWRCGHGPCLGRLPNCEARRRNDWEKVAEERYMRQYAEENMWREALGLPLRAMDDEAWRNAEYAKPWNAKEFFV